MDHHLINVGKVTAGGVGTGGTVWATIANMPLDHATAIASLAAATATTIYFLVATWIAIRNRNKNGSST